MPSQIASDLTGNRAALSLLDAPNAASATLPFKPKALTETAERELSLRVQQILAPPSHGRRKLWEFDSNLHCSIIGTCLTNAELRQALTKLGLKEAETATEHDLHKSGVVLAGKRHDGAKVLQKVLDRRHRVAINQFARAKTSIEVGVLWQEAVQRGEIPGAYWAALTHPATNDLWYGRFSPKCTCCRIWWVRRTALTSGACVSSKPRMRCCKPRFSGSNCNCGR